MHSVVSALPASAATAAPAAAVRIVNLETGEQIAVGTQPVPIVNGSRIRITFGDPKIASGSVRAFDASVPLARGADARWSAQLRYVDSSNPPAQNPALQISIQSDRGVETLRIPVDEIHQ